MQDFIFYNESIIGNCGLCGGPVTVPLVWYGINRPPATCKNCGATVKEDYGPRLPMNPAPKYPSIPTYPFPTYPRYPHDEWTCKSECKNIDNYSESFLNH